MLYVQLLSTYAWHIALAALGIAAIALGWSVAALHRRWRMVFGARGQAGEVTGELLKRVAALETDTRAIKPRLEALEEIGAIAVQKVGFLRFNPFEDTGGDQSFVLALLDARHTGVVISSLYSRDGTRIYAKRIEHGAPKQPLSGEEQKTLQMALRSKAE